MGGRIDGAGGVGGRGEEDGNDGRGLLGGREEVWVDCILNERSTVGRS